jgi:hypothetical protein
MKGYPTTPETPIAPTPPPVVVQVVPVVALAAPKPGAQTSELKVALLSMGSAVILGLLKLLGVAAVASGQWWALPASMAISSVGYSISRGLAKGSTVAIAPPAPATE